VKLGFLRRLAAAGSRRKGSALLIVLGFVSFMLVSAVAFSVYMRTERLSSSGYRNSVSTRHFCRATLAFAKDAIEESFESEDYAHLAHRFPGLGKLSGRWKGRVLYPKGKTVGRFTDTVATLSMEGLAYIPPAAVNDARQHSRHTNTAIWQRFRFEIARCSYTVLNVSDFLDVNKLRPGARTSGAFDRISLAYLWMDGSGEKFDPGDDSGAAAEDFGKFLDKRGSDSSGVPFVSLMDFNAALAKSTKSDFKKLGMLSPYYEYLLGGQGKAKGRTNLFYEGAEEPSHLENGDILKSARRGWFVTDSWSTNRWPKEMNPGKGYYANLAYEEGQPFKSNAWKSNTDDLSMYQIFKKFRQTTSGTPWSSGAEIVKGADGEDPIIYGPELSTVLFDYLDMDDTPISLAMPCTERAPMVAAVELGVDEQGVTVQRNQSGGENDDITTYSLKLDKPFKDLRVTTVFPFKHAEDLAGKTYEVEAFVRVWIESAHAANDSTRPGAADATQSDEAATAAAAAGKHPVGDPDKCGKSGSGGVNPEFEKCSWTFKLAADEKITVPSSGVTDENEAFQSIRFRPDGSGKQIDVLRKIKMPAEPGKTATYEYECLLVRPDGTPLAPGKFQLKDINALVNALGGGLVFRTAVWVAVKGEDGKYCDLVPACLEDDKNYNERDIDHSERFIASGKELGYPQLYFRQKEKPEDMLMWICMGAVSGGMGMGGGMGGGNDTLTFSYGNTAVVACDPRYNYAPENWMAAAPGTAPLNVWKEKFLNQDGRDSDIFMAVSNCTNLQSIAEFGMIPRWDCFDNPDRYKGGAYSSTHPDGKCFWRTFRLFNQGGKASDNLYSLGVVNMKTGMQRLNPYSDLPPIRLALVANTPYDWWSAGAGYNINKNSGTPLKLEQTLKYTFTPGYSSFKKEFPGAVMTRENQKKIAKFIFDDVRRKARHLKEPDDLDSDGADWTKAPEWYEVYDGWDWFSEGNTEKMLGLDLGGGGAAAKLHLCDKKFLYGFWRDCLGDDQQLFLVFCRAEPQMVNGEDTGSTPAQLGARSVALVWREPRPPLQQRAPHRTRLLYYHQFE